MMDVWIQCCECKHQEHRTDGAFDGGAPCLGCGKVTRMNVEIGSREPPDFWIEGLPVTVGDDR